MTRHSAVLYRFTRVFEEGADFIFRVDILNGPTLRMEAAGPPKRQFSITLHNATTQKTALYTSDNSINEYGILLQ